MPNQLKKRLIPRKRLAYKLVTYYGFLLILLSTIASNFSKFDAREFSPISLKEQIFFQNESLQTEQTLDLDEIFERNLSVETANGFDVILEDKNSGILSGINQSNLRVLQTFIYQSRGTEEPLQRRFENSEVYGPFMVKSSDNTYNQYFIKAVDAQEEWLNMILDSSFVIIAFLMLIGAPFLFWLSFKITKPVRELAITANTIASGNLVVNPKLETEGIYEIREVGRSFNHMVTSLQELTRQQQRMISDISHELKTPLARLQLALALLRRKTGETNEIKRIENEVHKLDKMIQDLLAISRQQLSYQMNKCIFPINEIWSHIIDDAKFETSQKNILLIVNQNIKEPENYFINGNLDTLASALENLIRNGQKYARKRLYISMNLEDETLIMTVEDDGDGVPELEYDNIFKPFYRLDEARARETGGTGLGLAIVHNAIQQHKGNIAVEKSKLGGLKVELRIPLWTQEII
ncbi:envelope stress sensor histidine kinase CpxA [Mannheimia cairinae]|uniref:envelope stress sensor histidine kinase CpxA n=1 Tax=Mannheimia cairinae TaxID=3025936 RepID=UPI00235F7B23|nr:envelope stress sensor histidine kinase CpxA [Mannheimia cairinae]MDD0826187.1 envelope stress sensor histidine kinase CpxA [Mannheimia cairinae]